MDHLKQALREKAEAYQRRMQQAHAQRLVEEVALVTQSLQAKAADVNDLAAAVKDETAESVADGELDS